MSFELVFCCLLVFCAAPARAELVELNHDSLSSSSLRTPIAGSTPFSINQLFSGVSNRGFWFASNEFCSPEQVGTHLVAPSSFSQRGWTLDKIPTEKLLAPGVLIDIRRQIRTNSLYELSSKDVNDWVKENGPFPNNSIILVHTGWSSRYGNPTSYYGNANNPSLFSYPGISVDAVRTLLTIARRDSISLAGVGIDGPSVDNSRSQNMQTHQEIAKANLFVLQNLNNLDKLSVKVPEVIAMPLKIRGGSGSPCRVMARTDVVCSGSARLGYNSAILLVSLLTLYFKSH